MTNLTRLALVSIATLAALVVLAVHHRHHGAEQAASATATPALAAVDASAPQQAADAGAAPVSDQQAQAACHPRLANGPETVPQVDAANVSQPGLSHMKIHLWVDGNGNVLRQQMVSADFGSPLEQAAELAFARQLMFAVPDIPDCHQREIEVIGDVYETDNDAGGWTTLVRLYPRFSFDARGVLKSAN
jgi:hypothetical protein